MAALDRYNDNLANPVASGNGCHSWLLSTGNLGVLAGIEPEQIHAAIRHVMLPGKRRISDREISDAIKKALADHGSGAFMPEPKPEPVVKTGKDLLYHLINQSDTSDEVDLWELSHTRLDWEPKDDPIHFLPVMYKPGDLLFIGERYADGVLGQTIRTTEEWVEYFRRGGKTFPHIILNPLSGQLAPKKADDELTLRGDYNVSKFKYCLIEFDNLSREQQIKFWTSPAAQKLPISCLIDSGGKSIHAWIKLSGVDSLEAWNTKIKLEIYSRYFSPLGVDTGCSSASRLSRLPGHLRGEKYQRILWLNTLGEGR